MEHIGEPCRLSEDRAEGEASWEDRMSDNVAATVGGTSAVELSLRRAAVMCAAIRALGVRAPKTRIGHGKLSPVATNETESGRRVNRRVRVRLDHFGAR